MKKFKYLLLVLFLFICLVACDDNKPVEDDPNKDDPGTEITDPVEEEPKEKEYLTVKFDTRCELTVDDITVEKGKTMSTPKLLVREGYTFKRWTFNDELWDFALYKVNQNMTLIAVWELNSYKLTVKYNNGNDDFEKVYSYNVKLSELTIPTKEGYTFAGWSIDGKIVSTPEYMPAKDITLEATYKLNTHTITVKYNDNKNNDLVITKDYKQKIEGLTIPTRMGYQFAGWDIVLPETMPDEDLVVNALWSVGTYNLNIKNYKELGKDYIINAKAESKLDIEDPVIDGYTFLGYYTGPACSGYKVTLDKMFSADYTIYACWALSEYKITYELNDSIVDDTLLNKINFLCSDYILPTPTKKGYVFAGWICDGKYITAIPSATRKDVTVTAVFNKIVTCEGIGSAQAVSTIYSGDPQTPYNQYLDEQIFIITGDIEGTNVGNYSTYITPNSGYCWSDGSQRTERIDWEILPVVVNVFWSKTRVAYTGEALTPTPIFMATSNVELPFTISETCIDVGVYTVHLESISGYNLDEIINYSISNTTTQFTIEPAQITECILEESQIRYTGSVISPSIVSVKAGNILLTSNDYTLSGSTEAINMNNYVLKVNGKGNFGGTISVPYQVIKGKSKLEPLDDEVLLYVFSTEFDLDVYAYNYIGETTWTIKETSSGVTARVDNGNKLVLEALDTANEYIVFTLKDTGNSSVEAGEVDVKVLLEKIPITVAADNLTAIKFDESIDLNGLNVEVTPLINMPTIVTGTPYFELEENDYISVDATYPSLIHGNRYSNDAYYTYRIIVPETITCAGKIVERQITCAKADAIFNVRINGDLALHRKQFIEYDCKYLVESEWYFYVDDDPTKEKIFLKTKDSSNYVYPSRQNAMYNSILERNPCFKKLYCTAYVKTAYGATPILSDNYNSVTICSSEVLHGETMNFGYNMAYLTKGTRIDYTSAQTIQSVIVIDYTIGALTSVQAVNVGINNYKIRMDVATDKQLAYTSNISHLTLVCLDIDNYIYSLDIDVMGIDSTDKVEYSGKNVTKAYNTGTIYLHSYYNYETISCIKANAFKDISLNRLYIPSTIKSIEDGAFTGFTGTIYFYHTADEFMHYFTNYKSWGFGNLTSQFNDIYILNENGALVKANTLLELN